MKKAKKIQAQRRMQHARRRYAMMPEVQLFWSVEPRPDQHESWTTDEDLDAPIPRPKFIAESDEPVEVHFELDYPISEETPVELRQVSFEGKTLRDVCFKIREAYERLYAEDARLGGPQDNGLSKALRGQQEYDLIHSYKMLGTKIKNRGFGPYVWGHDMGDLAVEGLVFEWKTPRSVVAHILIGS